VQSFEGQGGKFKPYMPFNRKPVELFKKFTVSLYVSCLCLRALLPDLNKMMMMMIMRHFQGRHITHETLHRV